MRSRSPLLVVCTALLLAPLLALSVGCSGVASAPASTEIAAESRVAPEPRSLTEPIPEPVFRGAEQDPVFDSAPEPAELPDSVEPEVANEVGEPPLKIREEDEIDSATLLTDSLEAVESAQVFWEQGSFDDAFAALDHAWQLMAAVPVNGETRVAQEKEDLRHLISRRVVEIYASRRTTVGDIDRSIPVEVNSYVEREIKSFLGAEREFFLESYRRSGLYRGRMLEELEKAGLPEQLSWLPLVESGFKVRAYSSARALGLWQFIPSTGYRFGLERSSWVDERMDPEKATLAAIAYLTELHSLFGDWLTVLAGYNCGEHNVLRQINRQRVSYFDQFWDVYERLPRETRRYVPRFLAVVAIVSDPDQYGIVLPPVLPPLAFETVNVDQAIELSSLDQALALEKGTLERLNPELRHKVTPGAAYEFKIPPGSREALEKAVAELPSYAGGAGIHRVRRGETLSQVAALYRTSVHTLVAMNSLRSPDRIWPGQQLSVPGAGSASVSSSVSSSQTGPAREVSYRVRPGDNLWVLAKRHGTNVERIKSDNGLQSNHLSVGQRLVIRSGAPKASGDGNYTVRRGDTLAKIAQVHGVSLNRLLSSNGLSRRTTIFPGQRLEIP